MSSLHFVKATYPLPVRRRLLWVRYAVAAFFVIITLAQLFAFIKMGDTIGQLVPAMSPRFDQVTAAVIVVLEVVALPSLLIVALSPAARVLSRVAGPLVLLVWYVLIYFGILTARIPNSGLLGSDVHLPANFWVLLIVIIAFVVTVATHYVDIRAQQHSAARAHKKPA